MTILPFSSTEATLETTGGKGANLARLTRAGFRVPPGFILPTAAYQAYVRANRLEAAIERALAGLDPSAPSPAALEEASAAIRAAFRAGQMPESIRAELLEAYAGLNGAPVAVRSSATTEDLPDLSFAGQQDTYLNVTDAEQLLRAVVDCWSSLWTARALGYRLRNGLGPQYCWGGPQYCWGGRDQVSLAVVVQQMVQSEVSGVLFTANPLSGLLSESVIDAVFGLGEALVSGQVEPDHFVVNTLTGEIVSAQLGSKRAAARSRPGGGVELAAEDGAARPTLSEEDVRHLAVLGQRVQAEYGAPQDIEWALIGETLYLLQSRPITSLFPVPEVSFDPLIVWFSFGDVQGVSGPITPLGRDTMRLLLAGGGKLFKANVKPEEIRLFAPAGERVWVRISDLIRNPLGFKVAEPALGFVEPSMGQIIRELVKDPRLGAGQGKMKLRTVRGLIAFFVPVMARLIGNLIHPDGARERLDALIESHLAGARVPPASDRFGRLTNAVAFLRRELTYAFQFLLPQFVPIFGPSMACLTWLNKQFPDQRDRVLELTRGLNNNVTTQMDLGLWRAAQALGADEESRGVFESHTAPELAELYLRGELPPAAQTAVGAFLREYGARGVGEIDFGRRRWREDPTPVMHTLQSYLRIEPEFAPDVVFERGRAAGEAAVETLAGLARQKRGGWLKEKLVRAAARRIRLLMGARESPKFYAVRMMGISRQALLEVGAEFAQAGTLEQADDLMFFKLAELDALAHGEQRDWKALAAERRAAYAREQRRRQAPRVLVSDGRAFYDGLGADQDESGAIIGSPVSPGAVEGIVHVILDPRRAQLAPGEILVCPGTDPAWTPLFLAAGGLITEVGGMMTHGSVVAREYGIPAVVGVHQATQRLRTGQRIRMDGSTGKIVVVDAG